MQTTGPEGITHFVEVPCRCGDIENCAVELYVSDVRILIALHGSPLVEQPKGVIQAHSEAQTNVRV